MQLPSPLGQSAIQPQPTQPRLVNAEFQNIAVSVIGARAGGFQFSNSGGTGTGGMNDSSGAFSFNFGLFAGTQFTPPKDDGTIQAACRLYAGSGVPNNANGTNGDFYFRSDTPAVANQRIYNRQAGAWVGIV